MRGLVDISIVGDKALQRKLKRLAGKVQRKVVRVALRKAARRIRERIIQNVSGAPVGVITGEYRAAWKSSKVRAGGGKRGLIRLGIAFPSREILGIAPEDKSYYPAAIEYGHDGVPAHPHVRPAVDDNIDAERRKIGRDIGKAIEREAKR